MTIEIFKLDAFTDKVFSGNQAAVCLLNEWIDEESMNFHIKFWQSIDRILNEKF